MAQMTAVEWLENQLKEKLGDIIAKGDYTAMQELFDQAKQMEKKQSKRDYYAGLEGYIVKDGGFECYYNETYIR